MGANSRRFEGCRQIMSHTSAKESIRLAPWPHSGPQKEAARRDAGSTTMQAYNYTYVQLEDLGSLLKISV